MNPTATREVRCGINEPFVKRASGFVLWPNRRQRRPRLIADWEGIVSISQSCRLALLILFAFFAVTQHAASDYPIA